MCPPKNSEIFDILPSHNQLSAKHLHNGDYLQLTVVRLRRSDGQFFGALAFCFFPSQHVVRKGLKAKAEGGKRRLKAEGGKRRLKAEGGKRRLKAEG